MSKLAFFLRSPSSLCYFWIFNWKHLIFGCFCNCLLCSEKKYTHEGVIPTKKVNMLARERNSLALAWQTRIIGGFYSLLGVLKKKHYHGGQTHARKHWENPFLLAVCKVREYRQREWNLFSCFFYGKGLTDKKLFLSLESL